MDEPEISQKELVALFAKQIGQTNLVIRCLVRALVQQPDFDADLFLKTLRNEEQNLTNDADLAKDVIKTIISEVEGYD